jgi:putative Holliday junction resolvase
MPVTRDRGQFANRISDWSPGNIDSTERNKERALVFDYGERRIGVAFADRVTQTITALKTIRAGGKPHDTPELDALVDEWQPDAIVIGVPYNTDGDPTAMSSRAMEFARRLGERYGLPIDAIDERLTSAEASMLLREKRRSGQRRRVNKEDIDRMAAQLIAETWLGSG